jgi:hypothetical protein
VATELLPKPIIAAKSIAGSFDISIARISTRGIMEKVINFHGGFFLTDSCLRKQAISRFH